MRASPATGPDTLQTVANWSTGSNWSLNRAPLATDDAVFDFSQFEFACTLNGNANTASVTFAANLPGYSILTVNGTLQTSVLTLNARVSGGGEVTLANGGAIVVTSVANFSGGNISGSLNSGLSVIAATGTTAALHVNGMSAADPPTLGAPLFLGGPSAGGVGIGGGGAPGTVTMDYSGIAAQALVVTDHASIDVNEGATINFDNQPIQANTPAAAIRNADGHTESIYVYPGGVVYSDGDFERLVGMGLRV